MLTQKVVARLQAPVLAIAAACTLTACHPEDVTCAGTGTDGLFIRVEDAITRQGLDSLSTGRIDRLTSPVASAEGPLWPLVGPQHPAQLLMTYRLPGTYRISVSAPGYRTEQVTAVVPATRGCIGTVPVLVRLTRAP